MNKAELIHAVAETTKLSQADADRAVAAVLGGITNALVKGEQVVLVDDILRSGSKLREMQTLLESRGARVLGLAVIIYQPTPSTKDFGSLPLYYLAKLEASYYSDAEHCDLCRRGVKMEKVWI